MELALAVVALVLVTIVFAISTIRTRSALKEAREDRNEIYRNCFLSGLAGILAKMAKADGTISLEETNVALRLFDDMGLSAQDRDICYEGFKAAKASNLSMSYYASLFAPYSTRESRILVYEILWDITAADGKLDPGEEQALKDLLKWLSLDSAQYDANLKRHQGHFTDLSESARDAGAKIDRILEV